MSTDVSVTSHDAVVTFENVSVRWQQRRVLSALNFSIARRGITVLLGPNGAGKSTLLSVLLGLRPPTEGKVIFSDDLHALQHNHRPRIGAVLQNEATFEGATVGEYATLFAALHGDPLLRAKILEMAKLSPQTKLTQSFESLSGGEQRRLQLAAALCAAPALLVLDEPTNHLDPIARKEILRDIQACAKHTAVLLATHDLLETSAIADHVLMLIDGKLVAHGTPSSLVAQLPQAHHSEHSPNELGLSAVFAHFTGAEL